MIIFVMRNQFGRFFYDIYEAKASLKPAGTFDRHWLIAHPAGFFMGKGRIDKWDS